MKLVQNQLGANSGQAILFCLPEQQATLDPPRNSQRPCMAARLPMMWAEKRVQITSDPVERLYSGKRFREYVLALLTDIAQYLCWLFARPCLGPISCLLVLALIADALQPWLEQYFWPSVAAVLGIAAILAVVVAPRAFPLQKTVEELRIRLRAAEANVNAGDIHGMTERMLVFSPQICWVEPRFNVEELSGAVRTVLGRGSVLLTGLIPFVVKFAIMFLAPFYFRGDCGELLQNLRKLRTISGIFGLLAPVIFCIAIALFAMAALVGTSLTWELAARIPLVKESWIEPVMLAAWNAAPVSTFNEILRPIVVDTVLQIQTFGVFLSIPGGRVAFGSPGGVLSLIILATTFTGIWQARAQKDSVSLLR
jgi:predicted PurR-regulated permease PerM